jgi:hypothetical protein
MFPISKSLFQVRAQAVRAVCSFIIAHEKEMNIQKHFQDLLPSMIQVSSYGLFPVQYSGQTIYLLLKYRFWPKIWSIRTTVRC